MATIVIPCEPRVLVNQRLIAQNLIDTVALSDRHKHEVWLLTPYRGREAVLPMIELLKNQFANLKTLELNMPVLNAYGLVTAMFARLIQVLSMDKTAERPIIWVAERGNELFKKGAIEALETMFMRRPCNTIIGKHFTIPAQNTPVDNIPEHLTADGTFVLTSKLHERYPSRVPYVASADHFRLFLAEVFTENEYLIEDWDNLIEVINEPDASKYVLPEFNGTQVVTKPQDVSVANFHSKTASLTGEDEQERPLTARDFDPQKTQKVVLSIKKKKGTSVAKETPVAPEPEPEPEPDSEFI